MLNKDAKLVDNLLDEQVIVQKPTRDGFGEGSVLAGKENENVVMLCADLTDSTRAGMFKKEFSDRFVQIGIAEQNMMGVAVGMAMAGKVPFLSTYGVFCPGRNWDQIRVNACYNNANVKFTGAHTGVSVGPDGATHQALEDIAITRCIPNITVIAPCDYHETRKATLASAKINGPVYLRFAREATPVFTTNDTPFEIGKALVLREGKDAVIIGCGSLLYKALIVAEELAKEGLEIMVVNIATIKPIDTETIIESAKKCGAVVSVEDHQVMGGLGSAVAEVLTKNYPVPQEFIGMQDTFGESGQPDELLEKYGMGKEAIKIAVKKVIGRKK
ncbi:MAG: transketolase [Candidatus Portnoybacteria bacterium CG10_big_fil_rev_8_21_14_0_10_36_7]|uniref:Transketolase n=1 Tax=Candidatus Portnoybacteria bacterium CG10_big_fil_rev_8_21_14_0_10_36_7 TaxID=1974812 RepID=A0A2M8KET5_9BACT|nr:MAG: transketolase [Candidatus Portnoybacteria bacterium CG10_big_fil_rev_8_21_14_0_10_36_7]